MICSSFNAWQIISTKLKDGLSWDRYVKDLGLSEEPKVSKKDLEREAAQAKENVNRIVQKALNGSR